MEKITIRLKKFNLEEKGKEVRKVEKPQTVIEPKCCCEENITHQHICPPKEYRIGANFEYSSKTGIYGALTQTMSSRVKTSQFFMRNSHVHNYSHSNISFEDKCMACNYCDTHGKTFYDHAPYEANLSFSTRTGDMETMRKGNSSLSLVQNQIDIVSGLPAACIVHIGTIGTIENVCENINSLNLKHNTHPKMRYSLLLENSAGQGRSIGKTWDEIRLLYEGLDRTVIGFCMDTAHLFASGMCDFSYNQIVDSFDSFREFCKCNIPVIHLNDSKTGYCSRVDRHEQLGEGHIWHREKESLTYIIERANEDGIDLILETPDPSIDLRNLGVL